MGWSPHLTVLAWYLPATRDGEDGMKWSRAISIMQLFPAVVALPCCNMKVFSTGPCRMCLCRSPWWAEAKAGPCSQPTASLSLPPPRQMPWPRRCKGLACLGWGDPAEGGCLQALAVSNVAAYKWKRFWVKNRVIVSFVVFLAVPGLGAPGLRTVTCQKLNLGLEI